MLVNNTKNKGYIFEDILTYEFIQAFDLHRLRYKEQILPWFAPTAIVTTIIVTTIKL